MTPEQVPAEAARLMSTDPVFHMRVTMTVQLVQREQGREFPQLREDPSSVREVATFAAACALVIADHPELLAVAHAQPPPWVRDLVTPMTADQLRQQKLL